MAMAVATEASDCLLSSLWIRNWREGKGWDQTMYNSSEVPPSKGSTTSPNYVTSWEPSVKTQELVREILHLNHRVLKPYP